MLRIIITQFWLISSIYSFGQSVAIDHIITLTPASKYPATVEKYSDDGFSIKPGRLHTNGLQNSHIKFSNGSSLELMTLTTKPSDRISQSYADLFSAEEQAVFIALRIESAEETSEYLTGLGISNELIINKLWSYVTFPNGSGMELFFLIEMNTYIEDKPSIYEHSNDIVGFNTVYVLGTDKLNLLLDHLGLTRTEANSLDIDTWTTYHTRTGNLAIQTSTEKAGRGQILKIDFLNSNQEIDLVRDFE